MEIQFYAVEVLRGLFPEAPLFSVDEPAGQGRPRIDATLGSGDATAALAEGRPIKDVLAGWRREAAAFAERRKKYLLYP